MPQGLCVKKVQECLSKISIAVDDIRRAGLALAIIGEGTFTTVVFSSWTRAVSKAASRSMERIASCQGRELMKNMMKEVLLDVLSTQKLNPNERKGNP